MWDLYLDLKGWVSEYQRMFDFLGSSFGNWNLLQVARTRRLVGSHRSYKNVASSFSLQAVRNLPGVKQKKKDFKQCNTNRQGGYL